jgi:hypothetical protein
MPRTWSKDKPSPAVRLKRLKDKLWRNKDVRRSDYPLPSHLLHSASVRMSRTVIYKAINLQGARLRRCPVTVNWSSAISVLQGPDPDYDSVTPYPAVASK